MDMFFVVDFELEYGGMVDFSRIILICLQDIRKKHIKENWSVCLLVFGRQTRYQ